MRKSQNLSLPFALGEELWANLGPDGVKRCVFTYANIIRSLYFAEERFFFSIVDEDSTQLSEFVLDRTEAEARVFRRRELAETTTFYKSIHLVPFAQHCRLSDECVFKNETWRIKT